MRGWHDGVATIRAVFAAPHTSPHNSSTIAPPLCCVFEGSLAGGLTCCRAWLGLQSMYLDSSPACFLWRRRSSGDPRSLLLVRPRPWRLAPRLRPLSRRRRRRRRRHRHNSIRLQPVPSIAAVMAGGPRAVAVARGVGHSRARPSFSVATTCCLPSFRSALTRCLASGPSSILVSIPWRVYWRCIGGVLEVYWRCIGGVLEVYWGCIGGVLGDDGFFFVFTLIGVGKGLSHRTVFFNFFLTSGHSPADGGLGFQERHIGLSFMLGGVGMVVFQVWLVVIAHQSASIPPPPPPFGILAHPFAVLHLVVSC